MEFDTAPKVILTFLIHAASSRKKRSLSAIEERGKEDHAIMVIIVDKFPFHSHCLSRDLIQEGVRVCFLPMICLLLNISSILVSRKLVHFRLADVETSL